jgi:hypothetical protein
MRRSSAAGPAPASSFAAQYPGQGDAALGLVLAPAVLVGGLAFHVGAQEDQLGYALVGVDLGGQRTAYSYETIEGWEECGG